MSDAGSYSRLLLKFRSGMRELNEELGRHRGREGKVESILCGVESENVMHMLWKCSLCGRLTLLGSFRRYEKINIVTLVT